jgi:N6-adenosine-specific RNA methylase IME4
MTVDEIAGMGCPAADDAHLYLWTTSGFLPDAFRVMAAWGFAYSTTLVWAKAPIGHGLGGAYGIATEFVLFGRRGRLPAMGRVGRNWFTWKRPLRRTGQASALSQARGTF